MAIGYYQVDLTIYRTQGPARRDDCVFSVVRNIRFMTYYGQRPVVT